MNCISDISTCLIRNGAGAGLSQFLETLISVVIITLLPLTLVIILVWVERKFAARIQDRLGPNRVGPFGLLQTVADAVKLITKEDITPVGADRLVFNLAPIISVLAVIMIWAVIPFSPVHIGVDLEIGALYFLAVGSIGTLGIMLAGWSSNNKYALLGAFRVVAQLVSYEVPNAIAVLIPILLAGTLSMQGIVEAQRGMWFFFMVPVSAVLFFVTSLAEIGRTPFDLLEAESEIVAGFNIEYSGMKFGLFFAGEFLHALTIAVLAVVLFFGGWLGFGADGTPVLGWFWLAAKTSLLYLFSLLVRSTLPRIRIDQLMDFNWKFLVPISLINLVMVAFLMKVIQEIGLTPDPENANNVIANLPQTIVLLAGNIALAAGVLAYARNVGRARRLEFEETVEEAAPEAHDEHAHAGAH